MALSDVNATPEQLEQLAFEQARLKAELEQKRELEQARADGPFVHLDADGTLWSFSIIDSSFVRIDSCQTDAALLEIPKAIDDMPVLAIGEGSCAGLAAVEEITCPSAIASIGPGAFQICPNLRRIVLPACVDKFDSGWLQRCGKLEDLSLSGRLEIIPRTIFANGRLKRLHVGASAHSVEPGTFERSHLELLEVDPANPRMATDGIGLYTTDGSALLAICRQVAEYEIADGCTRIAPKAAYGLQGLKKVTLPSCLREIGELAFARSGIEELESPTGLRFIGEKAFYRCANLEKVHLNEGLLEIEDSAFEGSAITAIEVPGSVNHIGRAIVRATGVTFANGDAKFSIAPCSRIYTTDNFGGLYHCDGAQLVLEGLLDEDAVEYQVADGTVAIAENALLRHPSIERVSLPEGVLAIGESAFRGCRHLKRVALPDSLVEIGAQAFADTSLESLRIPTGLSRIGNLAFATTGSRKIGSEPTLCHIEVDPANEVYETVDGLLCERTPRGRRVIAFDNAHEQVRFPDDVAEISGYALGNAHGIRELWLNSSLGEVAVGGLIVWSSIEQLHVSLAEPVEGRMEFDFTFPATAEAMQALSNALGGFGFVNVREISRLRDKSILGCHNFARPSKGQPSAHEQALLIVARLEDPVLLGPADNDLFKQTIALHLVEICVDAARHDDRQLLDRLADLGFLKQNNIDEVISAVSRLEDAATTAHLLEMKRRRFHTDPFDFSI